MASKGAYKRLTKEYLSIQKQPIPYIVAKPLDGNILEWHYVITGPEDSPYAGGEYHGKLIFPPEYPFKPPGAYVRNSRNKNDDSEWTLQDRLPTVFNNVRLSPRQLESCMVCINYPYWATQFYGLEIILQFSLNQLRLLVQ